MTLGQVADAMLDAGLSYHEGRAEITKELLEAALRKTKGNKTHAAKLLRLHRNYFDRRLAHYEIKFKQFRYPTRRTPGTAVG